MMSSHSSTVCRLATNISGTWHPVQTRATRSCSGAEGRIFGGGSVVGSAACALSPASPDRGSANSNGAPNRSGRRRLFIWHLHATHVAQQKDVGENTPQGQRGDERQCPRE